MVSRLAATMNSRAFSQLDWSFWRTVARIVSACRHGHA